MNNYEEFNECIKSIRNSLKRLTFSILFRIIRPRLLIYVFQERNIPCGMWNKMLLSNVTFLTEAGFCIILYGATDKDCQCSRYSVTIVYRP